MFLLLVVNELLFIFAYKMCLYVPKSTYGRLRMYNIMRKVRIIFLFYFGFVKNKGERVGKVGEQGRAREGGNL